MYHLHRLDHRHNFSPYFYLIYLTYPGLTAPVFDMPWWRSLLRSPLASFLPQMSLTLGLGLLFGQDRDDLVFAWFVQTMVFVIFNKVCTSQVRDVDLWSRALIILLTAIYSIFSGTYSLFPYWCLVLSFLSGVQCSSQRVGSAHKPCG